MRFGRGSRGMGRGVGCLESLRLPAAIFVLLVVLIVSTPARARWYGWYTKTLPKATFFIEESFILAEVKNAWDNEGKLGPIVQPEGRYEPTTGEFLGTLIPNAEATHEILVSMVQYGLLDNLTLVLAVPLVLRTEVKPNFAWEPGDIIAQYGRRFETQEDFWAYASGYGQPRVEDWVGNQGTLSDIVLGTRLRFTDWISWFDRHGLAGAFTLYGSLPTGTPPDPEEMATAGTTTWSLHFQGEAGLHLSADKSFRSLDDRFLLGLDLFYELFFRHEYVTPTGVKHKILLIDQDKEAGPTYTIDPGDFYGASLAVEFIPWKGPAWGTWLTKGSVEKALELPPLLTFSFFYTHTRFGQTDWESLSPLWDWEDQEEIWRPGYKNILTGTATVSLLRLGVPLQLFASYRNQSWIPGKNFRAADVINTGFRVPLKFW